MDFNTAVLKRDLLMVRILLKDALILDNSSKTVDEMIKRVEDDMPQVFEEHNGERFSENPWEWDMDFLNHNLIKLMENFSLARYEYLRRVAIVAKMRNRNTQEFPTSQMNAAAQKTADLIQTAKRRKKWKKTELLRVELAGWEIVFAARQLRQKESEE